MESSKGLNVTVGDVRVKPWILVVNDVEGIHPILDCLLRGEGDKGEIFSREEEELEKFDFEMPRLLLVVGFPEIAGGASCLIRDVLLLITYESDFNQTMGFSTGGNDYFMKLF